VVSAVFAACGQAAAGCAPQAPEDRGGLRGARGVRPGGGWV